WRQRAQSGLDRAIALAGGALVIQFCLGLTNVWLHIPLMIAVAHNAMGAGLLLSMVHLIWQHHQLARPALSPAPHTTTINREVTARASSRRRCRSRIRRKRVVFPGVITWN